MALHRDRRGEYALSFRRPPTPGLLCRVRSGTHARARLVRQDTLRPDIEARPQWGTPPYATNTDAEPLSTVLRVLSCGPEWGRAALEHEDDPR